MFATLTPTQTMKVANLWTAIKQQPCDNCGTMINTRFVLTNGSQTMTVGSECAKQLCYLADVDCFSKRMLRAAREWSKMSTEERDKHFMPYQPPGCESREYYINRRVTEMGNAMTAHKAWQLFERSCGGSNWLRHMYGVNGRARRLFKIVPPPTPPGMIAYGFGPQEPFNYRRVKDHMLGVFERRYHANRLDFDGATWNVAKI